jgi:hypothetical protein
MSWDEKKKAKVRERVIRALRLAPSFRVPPKKNEIKNIVFCKDSDELAQQTFCPPGDQYVSRASPATKSIFLTRDDKRDVYHECAHVLFDSSDQKLADEFMEWCESNKED